MSKTTKTTTVIKSNGSNPKPKVKAKKSKRNREVSAPLARARTMQTQQINTFSTPMREEYVVTIPGTTLPLAIHKTLRCNPGDPEFSKWGANIANCFESYKYDYLEIEYVPRCSANTSGYVAISPDTNPHDPAPVTEQELYANVRAKSDSPWKSFKVVFSKEMLNKQNRYFCRKNGQLPLGADKDLYDTAVLHLAGGGQENGVFIGQIWIRWRATFYTPESSSTVLPAVIGQNNSNVSQISPLGDMTAETIQQQVNNPLSSIVQDGVGSVLNFSRDFHGILSMKNVGTGITGAPSIQSILGASVNQAEGGVNLNTFPSSPGGSFLNSLITAKAGDKIRLVGPSGTLSQGMLSLMSCPL